MDINMVVKYVQEGADRFHISETVLISFIWNWLRNSVSK